MYKTRNLPNTRIDVADALRGIAVAGITLFHSSDHFDINTLEPITHTLPCDQLVLNRVAGHTTCGTLLSAFEHHDRPFETF